MWRRRIHDDGSFCLASGFQVGPPLFQSRKRSEIASLVTTFRPSVFQLYVEVDQDRVLKQGCSSETSTRHYKPTWAVRMVTVGLDLLSLAATLSPARRGRTDKSRGAF